MGQNVPAPNVAAAGAASRGSSRFVFSLCLVKLGKHLALLASLLILGQAAGHFRIGELTIFTIIVFSAISHSYGKACVSRAQLKRS
jgi:hypothetical protein